MIGDQTNKSLFASFSEEKEAKRLLPVCSVI
jgi:hypothetical protein